MIAQAVAQESAQFGPYEEEAIISLGLDLPEFFITVLPYLKPAMFARLETKYVMAHVGNFYDKYGVVPTRELLRDQIARLLTVDEPHEEIMRIIDRPSSPREVPMIRGRLREWARLKAYGLLYAEEAINAYNAGDLDYIDKIMKDASRINDTGLRGFWFFEQIDELLDPAFVIHYKTGWPRLDVYLNDGGPSPGEVLVFLAPTNVGKSVTLCNSSVNSVKNGLDTLHITFEMSAHRTARRCLGAMSRIKIKEFHLNKDEIRERCVRQLATDQARLAIYEMDPESCSVTDVIHLVDHLRRTRNWSPKVIVIDYLELMISKNPYYNRDEYIRQKHIAGEICGLAKTTNALIYTATQGNRSSSAQNPNEPIDLNKMAESYAKAMPPDYVISLNQSKEEYQSRPAQIRMFIAKNREGVKFEMITCNIDYDTMFIKETA